MQGAQHLFVCLLTQHRAAETVGVLHAAEHDVGLHIASAGSARVFPGVATRATGSRATAPAAAMAFDTLRVVQVLWALGDVLLTGGAFAVLGVYGSDADKNCRYGGLFLWTLYGIAPAVLYILGGITSRLRTVQVRLGLECSVLGGSCAHRIVCANDR